MSRRLRLVRHTEVDEACRGRCYGRSDVALSCTGIARLEAVSAAVLAGGRPDIIVHSGLGRTARLAERIGEMAGLTPSVDPRLSEIDYGAWEMRAWDAIHAEVGVAMMRIIEEPDRFAPPGGETLFQLRDRVLGWYAGLPAAGSILAVTHGGPIAALLGTLEGRPVASWPNLVPPPGAVVTLKA